MTGKEIRLQRLFSRGNAVIVAADHGEFDGPIAGMIELPRLLAEVIHPEVDGVLLSPGSGFGEHGRGYTRLSLVAPTAAIDGIVERLGGAGFDWS